MARSLPAMVDEIRSFHEVFDREAGASEVIADATPELVRVMREIRVPLVKAPHEVNGDMLSLADQCRYFTALAYENPTAAWTGFNHAGAAGMAGARLSDEGLDMLFGADPVPFFAAVAAPTGTYTKVDGGITMNGTWNYASGVKHAGWAMLTALDASGAPQVRMGVVSIDDAVVHGDWDVMALKGTGSVSITVDGVFVPDALTFSPFDGPLRGGPMYGLGYGPYVAGENLGFTFGVCSRFLDELSTYANGKSRGFDGRLADRGAFQYEYGRSLQQFKAAQSHALATLTDAGRACDANGSLSPREEKEISAMATYCTQSAVDSITGLMTFAGAGALFTSSVLQRCFRDAHGSAQHLVVANSSFDRYGAEVLSTSNG